MDQKILLINQHPTKTISRLYLKERINKIFKYLKLNGSSVDITFVDDAFMKTQNKKFMNKNRTTDVLSFPLLEPNKDISHYKGNFLGDILISLDQAARQAKEQKLAVRREVLFLIVHSILHLIGFDHGTEEEEIEMQTLEGKIWRHLNCGKV